MKRAGFVLLGLALLVGVLAVPAMSALSTEQPAYVAPSGADLVPYAAPASTDSELEFIRISPCRIADTRAAGGNFAANEARNFQVKGTTGFSGQGGTSGGCNIPDGAAAVEFTFTAVDQTGTGWMRMQPWANIMLVDPKATLLDYSTALNATNSVIVPVCVGNSCASDLNVKNYGASSGLLIDVTGYFAPELFAVVNTDGTLSRGSGVTSASKISTGSYQVIFDRDITQCAFTATRGQPGTGTVGFGFIDVALRAGTTNGVFVKTADSAATQTDVSFHLRVDC